MNAAPSRHAATFRPGECPVGEMMDGGLYECRRGAMFVVFGKTKARGGKAARVCSRHLNDVVRFGGISWCRMPLGVRR